MLGGGASRNFVSRSPAEKVATHFDAVFSITLAFEANFVAQTRDLEAHMQAGRLPSCIQKAPARRQK